MGMGNGSETVQFCTHIRKCVWELANYLINCKQTTGKCKQMFDNLKKSAASQTHFCFGTWSQNWTISVVEPFEITKFQMKHPGAFVIWIELHANLIPKVANVNQPQNNDPWKIEKVNFMTFFQPESVCSVPLTLHCWIWNWSSLKQTTKHNLILFQVSSQEIKLASMSIATIIINRTINLFD